jgi:hypothetical protein
MLTPACLRALAEIEATYATVASLYMPKCPVCGSEAIEAVADVVELAMSTHSKKSQPWKLVRSSAARRLITSIGPMAVLLRW